MGHNSSRNQALLLSIQIFSIRYFFYSYKMNISYLFLIFAGVIALGAVNAAPADEVKLAAEDLDDEDLQASPAQLARLAIQPFCDMQEVKRFIISKLDDATMPPDLGKGPMHCRADCGTYCQSLCHCHPPNCEHCKKCGCFYCWMPACQHGR